MFWRPALTIGLVLGLAAAVPGLAHAQTNIDQGKSAAEIFANDCATCHKGARGLANGKNSLTLSAFLREHYTASREQAATMAAYVLGAGGDSTPARGQKPGPEHARATVEEPKTTEPKLTEPKLTEPRLTEPKITEPKTTNPLAEPGSANGPQRPGLATREMRPVPTRGRKQEPEAAPSVREPAAATTAPAANETPGLGETPNSAEAPNRESTPTTSAAVPADSQPSDSAPVPRDDIPD